MLLLALSLAGCATGEVADGPAETAPTPASQATGSAGDTTAPTPAPASTPTPAVGDGEIRVAGLPFKDADTIVAEMWPGSVVEGGSVKRGTLRRVDKSDLNVPFEFNSAELTAEARAQLDELAQAIRMGPETWAFEVAGHTDAVGEQRYNRRLSILRARAAVDYLHDQHGIDPSRLEPVGYGEERLLDGLKPDSGVNRRVEVRPQEA
jgi:outer membrane protein OmpA-like peptidoglycan-associated protein